MPKVRTAKSFLLRKNFHGRRLGNLHAIFAAQSLPGTAQQFHYAVAIQPCFLRGHVNDEIRVGERLKFHI